MVLDMPSAAAKVFRTAAEFCLFASHTLPTILMQSYVVANSVNPELSASIIRYQCPQNDIGVAVLQEASVRQSASVCCLLFAILASAITIVCYP